MDIGLNSNLIYALDLVGTASFAFSGALRGLGRRPDIVGITILAGATAIGGGIVRDAILQQQVKMLWDVNYLLVILASAIVTYLFPRALSSRESFFKYFDAINLGIFSAIGASIAWKLGHDAQFLQQVHATPWYKGTNPLSVLFFAAITGAGGGVIRDILLNRVPLVLYKEIYILAVILGAGAMIVVRESGGGEDVGFLTAMSITTAVRVLAIRFNWTLPRAKYVPDWARRDEQEEQG